MNKSIIMHREEVVINRYEYEWTEFHFKNYKSWVSNRVKSLREISSRCLREDILRFYEALEAYLADITWENVLELFDKNGDTRKYSFTYTDDNGETRTAYLYDSIDDCIYDEDYYDDPIDSRLDYAEHYYTVEEELK